jgi:alpha-1,2-mannosyltransferase
LANWLRFNKFLTTRRLNYALIAGGMLWFAWMLSCLLGPGNMDLAGQVIGTDYLQFYSAGLTLRDGQSVNLYNFDYQSQIEQNIAGPGLQYFHAFITPPFLAWLYVPLTYLPYTLSFIVWSVLSLLFLIVSIKFLTIDSQVNAFKWSLTWFPIFAAISFGQNSLLSLLLFSITYWFWRKEKPLYAGLISSLLLFKPQMVLGLGILWILEWRRSWKSLIGLSLGGAILASLCFSFLPGASNAYVDLARNFLPGLIYQDQFPLWHLDSLRGFWILLLPGQKWVVESLSILLSALGIIGFILLWRRNRTKKDLLFAYAICLTIWITPHAMIYDWSILLIPAILLWQASPQMRMIWRPLYVVIWIAVFISGPLTTLQLRILPIAIQVSIPVFALVMYIALTIVENHKPLNNN